jgi:hypothetical protein|nr:MAG TPA: hypothetical protein [Caudoviricetes sp.]
MSKYIYIQKDAANIYVTMPEKLDTANNDIGTTWEDYVAGKYVLLTEEQIAFKEANEGASVEEVFNMQLTPIPEPTPEEKLQTAKDLKRQEVYNTDYRHYYIDDNDAYTYDRLSLKDQCTRKDTVEVNGKLYKSALLLEALNEMADYNDICISLSEKLISDIETAETVEDVEAIEVTGYPDVIHRTTDELQEAVDYVDAHDPSMQVMKVSRMSISAMSLDDTVALRRKYGHAEWKDFIGQKLDTGNRVLHDDWLWKVRQPVNPVLEIYPPSVDTASLYERMDEDHKGTEYDPKLYAPGMTLEQGKYYTEMEDGVRKKYYCFYGTIDPVYANLKQLINLNVRLV